MKRGKRKKKHAEVILRNKKEKRFLRVKILYVGLDAVEITFINQRKQLFDIDDFNKMYSIEETLSEW